MDKDLGVLEVTDQDIKNLMTEVFKCLMHTFFQVRHIVIRQCLSLFANIKLCLYFQVENAEGGEKLIDLSDAIVACGYTGPINVDQKKAITE